MPKESDQDYPGTSSTATVDDNNDNQNNTSSNITDGNSKKMLSLQFLAKKQRYQIEILKDTMKGMINEVVEAHKVSDQLFAQLEEQCMKMEEAQEEREAKMCQDDHFQM